MKAGKAKEDPSLYGQKDNCAQQNYRSWSEKAKKEETPLKVHGLEGQRKERHRCKGNETIMSQQGMQRLQARPYLFNKASKGRCFACNLVLLLAGFVYPQTGAIWLILAVAVKVITFEANDLTHVARSLTGSISRSG